MDDLTSSQNVFPVVLGAGERLFGENSDVKALRLVSVRTLGEKLVFVTYERARAASQEEKQRSRSQRVVRRAESKGSERPSAEIR